jgi:mono/diheme cytochrome c family protein
MFRLLCAIDEHGGYIMSHVRKVCAAVALCSVVLAGPLAAETKDVFAFIPAGGRTLLAQLVASHPPADELQAILSSKRSRDEWLAYLKGKKAALKALQALSDQELMTLADYLSFNMPLAGQSAADLAKGDAGKALPLDGRDFALEKCQGCHIITVVVTQIKTRDAWLGTMNHPSHTRIKLTREQREALANYLVIDGGIPVDDVPPELRAGGASY